MNDTGQKYPLAIAGVSHHTANVTALEAIRFSGEPEFLEAAAKRCTRQSNFDPPEKTGFTQ